MAYYYGSRKKKKAGIPSGILPKYRSMTYEELSATEAELKDELQRLNHNFTTSPEYKKIAAAESLINDYFQKAEKLRNEALNKIKQLLVVGRIHRSFHQKPKFLAHSTHNLLPSLLLFSHF